MLRRLLPLLLLASALSAQQLVVKYESTVGPVSLKYGYSGPWVDIDVDGDGVLEVFSYRNNNEPALFNPITGEYHYVTAGFLTPFDPKYTHSTFVAGKARSNNQAEFAFTSGQWTDLEIRDIATDEVLFSWDDDGAGIQRIIVRDFDGDGLDDYFVYYPYTGNVPDQYHDYFVVGVQTGITAGSPSPLEIVSVGNDLHLSWNSSPTADGYRILWAADVDRHYYTQVGFVRNGTSFTHVGFADVEPKGFYKVIAVTAGGQTAGVGGSGSW